MTVKVDRDWVASVWIANESDEQWQFELFFFIGKTYSALKKGENGKGEEVIGS